MKKDDTSVLSPHRQKLIERGKRTRYIRHMLGLNSSEFCQSVNISEPSLRQWESGRIGGLSEKGAKKIITLAQSMRLECSLDWLFEGNGLPPLPRNTFTDPLLEGLKAVDDLSIVRAEVAQFQQYYQNSLILKVKDNAMHPLYRINDYVGGVCWELSDLDALLGQPCIVVTHANELWLRTPIRNEEDGSYDLFAIYPYTKAPVLIAHVRIQSIAPVIRLWRLHTHTQEATCP